VRLGIIINTLLGILRAADQSGGSVSKPCAPSVHIKIAGKWMFIPLKMVLIGIDPYPGIFKKCECLIRKGQRQSQSRESAAPNVRVRNPPSEAGRRIKEPGGKQRVNNKDSVTPESYLYLYLSIYPSIHLSIYLSRNPMGTWINGTSTTKSPLRNLHPTLKKPQSNTK